MFQQWYVWVIALPILFVILFVKAGGPGSSSQSGGQQSARIIGAIGASGGQLITALEGGGAGTGGGTYV